MSADITTLENGYIGCNFCGRVTCHDATKLKIIWIMCKTCKLVISFAGPVYPGPFNWRSRFTKPAVFDRETPHGWCRETCKEITYWDAFENGEYEIMPEYKNDYHLLSYKPNENREPSLRIPVTLPNYNEVLRLCGIPVDDTDNDSNSSSVESEG